jgi:hypothetical protein
VIGAISPVRSARGMNGRAGSGFRMVAPPQQRLHADHPPRRQLEHGLVVEVERPLVDRLVQPGGHGQLVGRRHPPRRLAGRAAHTAGAVAVEQRRFQQGVALGGVARAQRHPDRG